MRVHGWIAAVWAGAAIAGCGKRVPEPTPHPATPHISWKINVGDRDNPDKTPACQSDPRSSCVIPVSTGDRQVFAMVHLYFHPATVETNYSGSAQVGFFDGSPTVHEMRLTATIKPGDSPGTNSVYDIVTSKAGTYRVRVAAVATPVPNGRPVNVRDDIVVVVK